MNRHSVLFLCTGNSARSQLAEAICRHLANDDIQVFSAGNRPEEIDARVYQVLEARGIPVDGIESKGLEAFSHESFEYVISLCDKAKDECVAYPASDALLHWDLTDPKPLSGIDPFNLVADELEEKIRLFLKLNFSTESAEQREPADIFKLMSDSTRLRILMLIEDEKELCVSDIAEAMQEIQPKISRHLAQMRTLNILATRRHGQQVFYHLAKELPVWVKEVLAVVRMGNPAFINLEKIRLKAMSLQYS